MRARPVWWFGLMLVLAVVAVVVWAVAPAKKSASVATSVETGEPVGMGGTAAPARTPPADRLGARARAVAEAHPEASLPGVPGPAAVPDRDAAAEATLERDRQIELLRASGPAPNGFLRAAEKVSRGWEELARATSGEIDVKNWECHGAGCFVTAVHRSVMSVEDMTSRILGSVDFASWVGPKSRSAPIPRADGTVEVTWTLMAAPEGADAGATPAVAETNVNQTNAK